VFGDPKSRFCGLLVYYRLYITCALVGFLFDVDQSTVWRNMQQYSDLLASCIDNILGKKDEIGVNSLFHVVVPPL